MARLEGVARVDVTGDTKREIKVNVNASKLSSHNLSILQVTQAISTANLDFPTGRIKSDNSQLLVRLSGKMKSVNDLRKLVITTTQSGNPIYLADELKLSTGLLTLHL